MGRKHGRGGKRILCSIHLKAFAKLKRREWAGRMGQGRGVFSFNINILPRSYTFVKREYKGTVRIDSNSGQFITRKKGEL